MSNLRTFALLAVAMTLLLVGCSSPAEPRVPPRAVVTLSGDGKFDSANFNLSGDYTVTWKTSQACSYYVSLEPGFKDVFSAVAPMTGTGNIHGLAAGKYYFHVNTGPSPECAWSVNLTPVD